MKEIKIAPSILSADFSKMGEEVKSLEESGADLVHCDVMDGVFVNNITFGIKMVEDLRKITSLPLDCHLMIVEPQKYVERFVKAGADIVTVHAEACKERLKDTLMLIKNAGAKCGAVINPDTPVSAISEVLPLSDMVLVMSVFPGFGGQKFIPEVLEKVRELRSLAEENGNVLVAGSAVFKAPDRRQAIEALRKN